MVLTKNEINRILETLPIGYYAKTGINVECNDGSDCYFDNSNDKIVIGCALVNKGIEKCPDDFDSAVAVRTILYHEVSHLIMTPLYMINNMYWILNRMRTFAMDLSVIIDSDQAKAILNTFEDERIESALRTYYMHTNFRWFISQFDEGTPATSAWELFYNSVRFRRGTKEILDKISETIVAYKHLTRNNYDGINDYLRAIIEIYKMCNDEFKNEQNNQSNDSDNNKENQNEENNESSGNGSSTSSDDNSKNKEEDDDEEENEDKNDSSDNDSSENKKEENDESEAGADEEENNSESDASDSSDNGISDEEDNGDMTGTEDGVGVPLSEVDNEKEICDKDFIDNLVAQTFNGLVNNEMIQKFRMIFKNFKTRGNVGGKLNAYSGVINPRNIVRKDYKYFDRSCNNNNGGSGKLHLNLFIDCSGSYYRNVDMTNQIIKSLETIERENNVFSFDVIEIHEGIKHHDRSNRYITAYGCNYLCPEMATEFVKMQKPDSRNYNIVLYDGKAYNSNGELKYFSAWNHDNVYIISDHDNERGITTHCKKAKKLFTWSCNYAALLGEKIYQVLQIAFGA